MRQLAAHVLHMNVFLQKAPCQVGKQVLVSLSACYLQILEPHIITISTSFMSLHNPKAVYVPAGIGKMVLCQ